MMIWSDCQCLGRKRLIHTLQEFEKRKPVKLVMPVWSHGLCLLAEGCFTLAIEKHSQ